MSKAAQFLQNIKSGAIAGWHKYGILPSVSAAQAAIESGWGESGLAQSPNYNLFGIKGSFNGQSVTFPTQEWDGSKYVTVQANFRKYPSWAASVEDHGSFFHEGPRYLGLIGMQNYEEQCLAIQNCGYATDPNYASKLIATIRANGLEAWDQEALTGASSPKPVTGNQATYTVQNGDTLSGIAEKFQTTVAHLTALNGIANPNLIFVGQLLKIGAASTERCTYTVQSGDVLSIIAEKLGVTTAHLVTKNQLENPNLIYPGQRLKY